MPLAQNAISTPFPLSNVRWETYGHFVENQLCWVDGATTHVSTGKQRQCPVCRRKWSYHDRALALMSLSQYCQQTKSGRPKNPTAVAREMRCSRATVTAYYAAFDLAAIASHLPVFEADKGFWVQENWAKSEKKFQSLLSKMTWKAGKPIPKALRRMLLDQFHSSVPTAKKLQLLFEKTLLPGLLPLLSDAKKQPTQQENAMLLETMLKAFYEKWKSEFIPPPSRGPDIQWDSSDDDLYL